MSIIIFKNNVFKNNLSKQVFLFFIFKNNLSNTFIFIKH